MGARKGRRKIERLNVLNMGGQGVERRKRDFTKSKLASGKNSRVSLESYRLNLNLEGGMGILPR